jgi:HNH endonuclease/AP2 domain
LWNVQWAGKEAGKIARYKTSTPYRRVGLDGSQYLVHRIIWKLQTGEDIPKVDHRNNDGLCNRFSNLRPATASQNNANARKRITKELPKGVRKTTSGKYEARIRVNGKAIHIGNFTTAAEAHRAYVVAAEKYHGAFANAGHR